MRIFVSDIILHASTIFGANAADLLGKRRQQDLVLARHAAMFVAKQLTKHAYADLGRYFDRDHSSIIHACDKVLKNMRKDPRYRAQVCELARTTRRCAAAVPLPAPPPPDPDSEAADQAPWWQIDDDELLTEAVREYVASGGDFVEVWR